MQALFILALFYFQNSVLKKQLYYFSPTFKCVKFTSFIFVFDITIGVHLNNPTFFFKLSEIRNTEFGSLQLVHKYVSLIQLKKNQFIKNERDMPFLKYLL